MGSDPLVFAATSDLAGKLRGKAFPLSKLTKRLKNGVGWVPTNALITCFDSIAPSPFGSLGDLLLMPDAETLIEVDFADGTAAERIVLCDIMTTEGAPWNCCTRSLLKSSLERLSACAGLTLKATFEHEFQFKEGPAAIGTAFTAEEFSLHRDMGEKLMAALTAAGLKTDTFLKEFGPNQFEVTLEPEGGITSADHAALLRSLTHMTARRFGRPVTFSPIINPAGVGNGVHIHMSFLDAAGQPATYNADGPGGMSPITQSFVAGVLRHLPQIICLLAPSVVSYARLTPHRWSAAYNNLGFRDRQAAVRICPVTATDPLGIAAQFNFEVRAIDAAASPHLALAALVHAGCQGIEEALNSPEPSQQDLSTLAPEELAKLGVVRLPTSLSDALDSFKAAKTVRGWFPEQFAETYLDHKYAEIAYLEKMEEADLFAAYKSVY